MQARLLLSDGTHYEGLSFGKEGTAIGEVVFHTAMCGYQEILTDPSYHFQLVTMTYPQIGNYGVNPKDFESRRIYAAGFIIREYSPIVSHWQANRSLDEYLKFHGVVGISDIDTRALTRHLRDHGAQMGLITTAAEPLAVLLERLRGGEKLVGRDIVKDVTTDTSYVWPLGEAVAPVPKKKYRVAVYDFGVKFSILRSLYTSGCELEVFPAATPPEKILAWNPDGIFLSNGPGDPEPVGYAVQTVRELLGKKPIFGICLGHQLLGLASAARPTSSSSATAAPISRSRTCEPARSRSPRRTTASPSTSTVLPTADGRGDAHQPERPDDRGHAPHDAAGLLRAVPPRSLRRPARQPLPLRPVHQGDGRLPCPNAQTSNASW